MKKKKKLNIFNWLKDAGLKAIVILLVVVTGFYAYAQIEWPKEDPNPTTGVVGMFVGATENTYSASSNYATINTLCSNHSNPVVAGSHVCTPAEMMNSYNHATASAPIFTYKNSVTLWVNSAAPGNISPAINDCNGWSDTNWSPYYGTVWNFNSDASAIQPCAVQMAFACCK